MFNWFVHSKLHAFIPSLLTFFFFASISFFCSAFSISNGSVSPISHVHAIWTCKNFEILQDFRSPFLKWREGSRQALCIHFSLPPFQAPGISASTLGEKAFAVCVDTDYSSLRQALYTSSASRGCGPTKIIYGSFRGFLSPFWLSLGEKRSPVLQLHYRHSQADAGVHDHVFQAADIWSLGVTLYCLVVGSVPFHDPNILSLYNKILTQPFSFPAESDISPEVKNLIGKMMTKDPVRRITLAEIKVRTAKKKVVCFNQDAASNVL